MNRFLPKNGRTRVQYLYDNAFRHGNGELTDQKGAFMQKILMWVVMALFLVTPVLAETTIKEQGKEIGQAFKKGGKETGHAFKEGGKEVGHAFKEGGKEVGQGFKEMGKETGKESKKAGRTMGDAFKQMGRDIKGFFTGK